MEAVHFFVRRSKNSTADGARRYSGTRTPPLISQGRTQWSIYFAGSDGGEIFYAALLAAQTKYRLFSCYKYILKRRPDDDFRLPVDHVIRVQDLVVGADASIDPYKAFYT